MNITTSRGVSLVLFVQAYEKARISTEAPEEDKGHRDIASEDSETMHEATEDGDASQERRQAIGEADKGEDIPEIVDEFERESEEHAMAELPLHACSSGRRRCP